MGIWERSKGVKRQGVGEVWGQQVAQRDPSTERLESPRGEGRGSLGRASSHGL